MFYKNFNLLYLKTSESAYLTYYQKNRDVILNREKDYYENNKERLRMQARDKYKNLSEEESFYVFIIIITISSFSVKLYFHKFLNFLPYLIVIF